MGAPAYKLTSWDEIEYIYSATGASLVTDDLGTDLTAFKNWVVDYATEECLLYLGTRYKDLQDLSTSNIVRMWASIMGAYRVSTRRGNPELFQGARDEVIEYLNRVQAGSLSLPDVVANANNVPSMSNYNTDPKHLINGIRKSLDSVSYGGVPNDHPQRLPFWFS